MFLHALDELLEVSPRPVAETLGLKLLFSPRLGFRQRHS